MVAFFKYPISRMQDDAGALSDGEFRVLHVALSLIYQHEGPITLNERGLAGLANQTVRAFRKNLEGLLGRGLLTITGGKLTSRVAEDDLEAVFANRANAAKGGRTGRNSGKIPENFEKPPENLDEIPEHDAIDACNPLKINDQGQATLPQPASLKDKKRVESTPTPETDKPAELPLGLGEGRGSDPPRPKRKRRFDGSDWRDDPDFRAFKAAYPRLAGGRGNPPKTAYQAFHRIVVETKQASAADLIAAAKRFARHWNEREARGDDRKWVPMAASWLNSDEWTEHLPPVTSRSGSNRNGPGAGPQPPPGWPPEIGCDPDMAYRVWLKGSWPSAWKAGPGLPGCLLPEQIQREWKERRDREAGERDRLALQVH